MSARAGRSTAGDHADRDREFDRYRRGQPTGTVQFEINGTFVGIPIALVKGTASIVVPSMALGNYQIAASYFSDTLAFTGSNGSRALAVTPAPVSVRLQSNSDWLQAGQDSNVVAIASSNAAVGLTPTGPSRSTTME